jgi:hypothetical protein
MTKKKGKRSGSITAWRFLKGILIFGPVTAKAANAYVGAGGGMNGVRQGILPAITTSYIGLNTNDGQFYWQELVWGWAPVLIVKAAQMLKLGRLFRI